MAETPSTMVSLGSKAPDFELKDVVSGQKMKRDDFKSNVATVIMFICNHCPFVKHIHTKLAEVAKEYMQKGVKFAAINSNDVENYPDDSPEKMKLEAQNLGYTFPYMFDESQDVAKAYNAACTPDFFVYDSDFRLVYRGQFDDSRPGNHIEVTGRDLKEAIDDMIAGRPVDENQKPSIGCNIKWKQ
jgi:thiol-disulfide isomerase/thioredoxin